MELLNELFDFVIKTSEIFKIDESHSLKHSMDVYYLSNRIYDSELNNNPYLVNHKKIIDISAILHDMCDKKYMDEQDGLYRILQFLKGKISDIELFIILEIISSMSYSTVKKNGFPNLGEYQLAYNIVREADLLASYDFDRCVIYQMLHINSSYEESYINARELFEKRMFKYIDDNLFVTEYSKVLAKKLQEYVEKRLL